MKRLEEICIFIRNGLNIKNNKSKKGIPITRIETISNGIIDINKTGYADIFNEKYSDYYLQKDDILMSHINSLKHLGKVGYCYYDMKIIHGMNLLNIRVNPNNVYPKYLYYYFKIKLNKISKQSVNQSSFSISDLKKIRIDIIDLKKQKLIASKLDKVVEVISIRKKQIEELNNLIKSQFVEMFGDPIINEKKWNVDTIKNVAPRTKYFGKFESKVWILNLDMIESGTGNIIKYMYEDLEKIKSSTCTFNEEYVLYSKLRPYLNKVVVPIRKGYATSEIIPLKPDITRIEKQFLAYLLRSEQFVNYISLKTIGAKMPRVSMEILMKFNLILPPLSLQNQFSEIVKQIDKQKFESMIQLKMMEKIYNIINDRRRYV